MLGMVLRTLLVLTHIILTTTLEVSIFLTLILEKKILCAHFGSTYTKIREENFSHNKFNCVLSESHKGISYYDFDLLIKFTIIKMGSQLLTFCQMTRLKKFKQTDHLTSLRKF